ncbi:hypothetical protein V8C44DRAFT_147594 [Trichoderma aethiopicum]
MEWMVAGVPGVPLGSSSALFLSPSSRHHNLLPTLDNFISTCSLLFFWVIKSKFTVHVLAHVMDGCLIAISCWISLSNLFISLLIFHNFLFLACFLCFLERALVSRRHGMGRGRMLNARGYYLPR